jgi:hypothetical protein
MKMIARRIRNAFYNEGFKVRRLNEEKVNLIILLFLVLIAGFPGGPGNKSFHVEIDKNKNLIQGGYDEKIISSVTGYNSFVRISFHDFYAGVEKN